ncbi:MAG TPA: HAD-IA family hydrolase [Gemmatimonadales bacterium]|nr:HAD-IA family hydrolase [Gemmatimonadales bacterium]
MALDALILDIDGTLVDTNRHHLAAWEEAFRRHGYRVARDRIRVEIGKGGDQLVPAILGCEADARDGDALRAEEKALFLATARSEPLALFPGVRELVAALRARGLRLALATSSGREQIDATFESARATDVVEAMDVVVTKDDAAASKPAPDTVTSAVRKLGLTPAQCAMVGDTPWDAEACRGAGVVCLGVRSGGNDARTLLAAGARAVWPDAAALHRELDAALERASPGPAHLDRARLEQLMRAALAVAREGLAAGDAPIGAVLARGDGTIIARGWNRMWTRASKVAHAEMVTFEDAVGKVPLDARDLLLVSTLEPCVMCTGAAMVASVDTIVYGLVAPPDSGTRRVRPPESPESQMPRIVGGVLAGESRALFEAWLRTAPNPDQRPYVEQLLASTSSAHSPAESP